MTPRPRSLPPHRLPPRPLRHGELLRGSRIEPGGPIARKGGVKMSCFRLALRPWVALILSMSKKVILRVELTPQAKSTIEDFAERAGMTQFTITSRLVEWFAQQPETIQSFAVKRYPPEIEADVAKMLLKRSS